MHDIAADCLVTRITLSIGSGGPEVTVRVVVTAATVPPMSQEFEAQYADPRLATIHAAAVTAIRTADAPADETASAALFRTSLFTALSDALVEDGILPS